jgi:hypothetical protein
MKKYQYQINERVLAYNDSDWIIPGTITAKDHELYKVEYDSGGYDWLICDEMRPLEYRIGDYVESMDGVGRIVGVNSFCMGTITVSYGRCATRSYCEHELRPAQKPSLLARLLGRGMYLYA